MTTYAGFILKVPYFNDGPVSLSAFSGAAPDEGQTTTSVNIMAHSSKDIQKLPSLPEGSPAQGRQARIRDHIDFMVKAFDPTHRCIQQ